MATHLKIGDKAPAFEALNQNGETLSLDTFKGKKLVIYFYPKDSTPGCTAESCDLRDNYDRFKAKGYEILGVSGDSAKSHLNFIAKHSLPFDLLVDEDKKVHELFGTWGEKKMYGKTYMGTLRTTFVIDENGVIEDIIEKVKTKEHSKQLLKD